MAGQCGLVSFSNTVLFHEGKIHSNGYREKAASNSKSQAPNDKWFGQLTILSQVERQIQNPNDPNLFF
jgi:hypothetical protein